ncbi:Heat shock protein beta-1 [Dirofilaria immitis]|nr:Heat shock protein beta-1 [Dirofilaria immitis]
MRERFEAEMKHVEEEMKRLRREFEGRVREGYRRNNFKIHDIHRHSKHHKRTISSTTYHREESRRYESSSTQGGGPPPPSTFGRPDMMSIRPTYDPYLENLKSPLIKDESDGKTLRLRENSCYTYLKLQAICIQKRYNSNVQTLCSVKNSRIRFDVAQYKPEEVTVKTVDNRLLVHAKHEEKTPQRSVFREYNQEFMLPRGTNPELISSTLSTDGV